MPNRFSTVAPGQKNPIDSIPKEPEKSVFWPSPKCDFPVFWGILATNRFFHYSFQRETLDQSSFGPKIDDRFQKSGYPASLEETNAGLFVKEVQSWVDKHFASIKNDLFTFLRFKTISSDPSCVAEHQKCAEWLRDYLQQSGCQSEVISTPGLPLVYAEDLRAGPLAPTLLIYGHYDVQPVDPIDLWKSDPFEPVEKKSVVYARGAQDDKGQIFFAIQALRYLQSQRKKLPVNLKFCIEGEEENGSEGLSKALPRLKDKLKTDDLLVIDFDIADAKTPAINLGARGIITLEAVLRGSNTDLHSGGFGGIAYNPNRAAAELISILWDETGRVAIPHFYDDVVELSKTQRALFSKNDIKFIQEAGIEAMGGEAGFSPIEACWLRPTLEINGLAGGYAGKGVKTVIPAEARIKISCRLVPNQDPQRIGHLVRDYLIKKVKKGIHITVEILHGGKAYRGSADSKLARAVSKAYEEVMDASCQKILSGGSIPVVAELMNALHPNVVGMGYGLSGDNIHAPNEHFDLKRFKMGIMTVVRTIEHLGEE
jgi:acetylornithine deacetylase/succinyl-diaminopimelate desuccinylase-like protein